MRCRDCGLTIEQRPEKALSGEVQMVWADNGGEWVCDVTGDEHVPGEPKRPVKVIVEHGSSQTYVLLSLAEYGNFIARPIIEALDDADVSAADVDRHNSIALWAAGLYRVTS
jgi:hypothetical protein